MIKLERGVERWLNIAVGEIRFKPDREAVRQELQEHFEDKTADLMRIFPDMSEEEAVERALSQMGDPKEIGVELAKIHKPWWGYIWKATHVIASVLVVWMVLLWVVMAGFIGGAGFMEYYVQRRGNEAAFAYTVMSSCLAVVIGLTLLIRLLAVSRERMMTRAD